MGQSRMTREEFNAFHAEDERGITAGGAWNSLHIVSNPHALNLAETDLIAAPVV
jgi:hypothetical protein